MASPSTTHFFTSPREGISYITSSRHSSNTVRSPRAPVLWRSASAADAPVDDCVERPERASANEENIRGVDLNEVLVRVLAPALRGHIRNCPLDDLQQRLLDTFAGNVTRDRRVVPGLAPNLVDLVDVDDAPLGLRNIEVRRLDQSQKYVLDVLAYVARLS